MPGPKTFTVLSGTSDAPVHRPSKFPKVSANSETKRTSTFDSEKSASPERLPSRKKK